MGKAPEKGSGAMPFLTQQHMSNENMTKARIAKITAQINAAGLKQPEIPEVSTIDEQDKILRDYWAQNKPKVPKKSKVIDLGEKTDDQANKAMIEAMQKQIAELQSMISRATAYSPQAQVDPSAFAEAMKAVLDQQKKGNVEDGEVQEGYVPPHDVLEQPITYFCPQQNEYLSFRWEGGLRVTPPNGKKYIKFDNKFRWAIQTVNGPKVRAISTYVCRSKSESEWIENHPKFNRTVFRESNKAIEASEMTEWTIQFNRNFANVAAMSDARLPQLAHSMGIPVSPSTMPDEYRQMIAEAQTRQHFEHIKANVQAQIAERDHDRLLVSSPGN